MSGEGGDSNLIIGISVMKANVRFDKLATLPANSLSCLSIIILIKLSMIVGTTIGNIAEAGDRYKLIIKCAY